jgi:hypothetical protein
MVLGLAAEPCVCSFRVGLLSRDPDFLDSILPHAHLQPQTTTAAEAAAVPSNAVLLCTPLLPSHNSSSEMFTRGQPGDTDNRGESLVRGFAPRCCCCCCCCSCCRCFCPSQHGQPAGCAKHHLIMQLLIPSPHMVPALRPVSAGAKAHGPHAAAEGGSSYGQAAVANWCGHPGSSCSSLWPVCLEHAPLTGERPHTQGSPLHACKQAPQPHVHCLPLLLLLLLLRRLPPHRHMSWLPSWPTFHHGRCLL